jgi:hypothetical protein
MMLNTVFDDGLSDMVNNNRVVTEETAAALFQYFKTCPLFRWNDANNDCEDRANALCILLDNWSIPNYKAWVFSGYYLRRDLGSLINFWNYHVAASVPVMIADKLHHLVLDPATLSHLSTIEEWANNVTGTAHSYHLIKNGVYYIFAPPNITRDNWHKRDRRNYKWTIQGLSGINGVSRSGKAQLVFNKSRIQTTEKNFKTLLHNKPEFF